MAVPILRLEHLTREVGQRLLLSDVSFDVAQGEVLAITGPSGSGKSTLLRLINRLDEPTAGTVYLAGIDYRTIPPRQLRRRVGMVMQTPWLFPGTVADNVRFGPAQWDQTISDAQVQHLLSEIGLADFADRDVSRLSGGEAQRVSLARTLANRPEILLLDEPTSALDPGSKEVIEALIIELIHEHQLTALIVTHDVNQARRMAKRAAVIVGGRLERIDDV
ncbi:MAG: ATP-binding cassette domain-containing protein [Bacillota bacterium]